MAQVREKAPAHIGASGWHYKHWRGPFYPEKLPASKMLEFYCERFDTVEINNSFYRLPSPKALEAWRAATPKGFCFAVKGSRFLTHMKKLKDPESGLAKFMPRIEILGKKLGPILFQLPPFLECKPERLQTFLEALPKGHRYTFEFRNPGWHVPRVYDCLRKHRAAFCIFDLAGFHSPLEVTAGFVYVRLHGPGGAYQGSYSSDTLKIWAQRVQDWRHAGKSVYVYFDNDQSAFAVHNALELKGLCGESHV